MKVSLDKTMDDIVSIQNQINGLQLLLNQKKGVMAKYFDHTGNKSVSNSDCTVYVSERTNIDYDIAALKETLPKELFNAFVETEYTIADWKAFSALMKAKGVKASELTPFISVFRKVNQEKLSKLYEHGKLSLTDLNGCYEATVKKSIILKLKNTEREIPIKENKKK